MMIIVAVDNIVKLKEHVAFLFLTKSADILTIESIADIIPSDKLNQLYEIVSLQPESLPILYRGSHFVAVRRGTATRSSLRASWTIGQYRHVPQLC